MSQADYLHFFNNIVWNLIQFILLYVIISVVFVQNFYKFFRVRLIIYKKVCIFFKKGNKKKNSVIDFFKRICKDLIKIVISYKIETNNNRTQKCFYE